MSYSINNMPDSEIRNHSEWIPVFRTGTHTDSNGNEKTWTEAELDLIAAQYRPDQHEAPAVIGHPKDNSPAWGWVEALKRDGHVLYAKFNGLVPEFVDMVRKGLFKKRSISLYPDMTLRHVGFLGAMPPAVKGLPDVAFQDGNGQIIEFAFDCKQCKSCLNGLNSFNGLNNCFGREAKSMKWFDWMKKKAADEGVTLEDAPAFSEANPPPTPASGGQSIFASGGQDVEALVNAKVAKQVKDMEREFAEKLTAETKSLESQKAELDKEWAALERAKAEKVKADIASFCEGLAKEGRITPAMMKHGMGMQSFLESIAGIETRYEFCESTPGPSRGESQEVKKQTPFEFMRSFLSGFKKQIEFGEIAGAGKDIPRGNDKREAAIREYQEKNKGVNYKEAVLAVSKEYPGLFTESCKL